MKKIFLPVLAGLLATTPVFSASISDNYCSNSLATLCLGINDIRDMAEMKGVGDKVSDEAIKLITKSFLDKAAIDLDKDFEHVGLFVAQSATGVDVLGFVTGDFSTSKKVDFICETVKNSSNGEAKIENVTVAGESKQVITVSEIKILFLNKNTVLFSKDETMQNVITGSLSLAKAPDSFNNLFDKTNSFLTINSGLLGFLNSIPNMPKEIAPFIGSVSGSKNLALYLKDSLLNFDFQFADNENAEIVKNQFMSIKENLLKEGQTAFDTAKNKLNAASANNLLEAARDVYSSSKNIDYINQVNVETKNNSLIISMPFDKTQAVIGAVGIGAAMAIPNFQKARGSARQKACFSNQRVLSGAVEMYNMDNAVMMKNLDIDKLVKGKYLRTAPAKPEAACDYYSEGDLTAGGKVSCKLHGNYDDYHMNKKL